MLNLYQPRGLPRDLWHAEYPLNKPGRDTKDEALADWNRLDELFRVHAPEFMTQNIGKRWKRIPGTDARLEKARA